MFVKFITYVSTFYFANGIGIGNKMVSDDTGAPTDILSEGESAVIESDPSTGNSVNVEETDSPTETLYSDVSDLPDIEWDSSEQLCYSWAIFQDYDLKGACDSEGEFGSKENKTMDDLKNHAEKKNYDGFAFFTDAPGEEWVDAVWYKKCDVQDSDFLAHGLVP